LPSKFDKFKRSIASIAQAFDLIKVSIRTVHQVNKMICEADEACSTSCSARSAMPMLSWSRTVGEYIRTTRDFAVLVKRCNRVFLDGVPFVSHDSFDGAHAPWVGKKF